LYIDKLNPFIVQDFCHLTYGFIREICPFEHDQIEGFLVLEQD